MAVIEVGLGGRFDATNVIAPAAGAITTIGFDHQQHLGHTLAEIAFEKAGIIKPGMTVVTGTLPEEARTVIQRVADERGATAVRCVRGHDVIGGDARRRGASVGHDPAARLWTGDAGTPRPPPGEQRARGHPPPRGGRGTRHRGDGGRRSHKASHDPQWPARLELFTLENGRRVLLDAAHNLDGAAALADYLRQWHRERPALVLGVMRDKDVDAMLALLIPEVSSLIATAAPTPRAMSPDDLARHAADVAADLGPAHRLPIATVADPEEAVQLALERSRDVCVAGSIFLAGAVRADLQRRAILR